MNNKHPYGITLIELVIVVTLLGVLIATALPVYQWQVITLRRGLARVELLQLAARQEEFLLNHGRYANSLAALGLPQSPYAIDARGTALEASSAERIYLFSLVTGQDTFKLVATPQGGQAHDQLCGALSIDSRGVKRSAGSGSLSACW